MAGRAATWARASRSRLMASTCAKRSVGRNRREVRVRLQAGRRKPEASEDRLFETGKGGVVVTHETAQASLPIAELGGVLGQAWERLLDGNEGVGIGATAIGLDDMLAHRVPGRR